MRRRNSHGENKVKLEKQEYYRFTEILDWVREREKLDANIS